MKQNKPVFSTLPILFVSSTLFIGLLNLTNFLNGYRDANIEIPYNKQQALASIETKYTDNFIGKTNYVDLNGAFSLFLGRKELNERFLLENDFLTNTLIGGPSTYFLSYHDYWTYTDQTASIQNVKNLHDYLALYGIPYAFLQTPHLLTTDDDPTIPAGYSTSVNDNSDRLLAGVAENGIPSLDMRASLQEQGLNSFDIFFKTDHHWTIEGAFWAHIQVAEYIDDLMGTSYANPDYYDLANYNIEIYENSFMGPSGSRTGIYYAGIDDFSVITPNFDTEFQVEIPNRDWYRTGPFDHAMLDYSYLENDINNMYKQDAYCTYLLPNTEYVKLVNLQATNDLKVLLVKDSFSMPMAAFLSLHFAEVHLCQQNDHEEFLRTLHEIEPDVVLQMRTAVDRMSPQALADLEANQPSYWSQVQPNSDNP
ncbi:MAG: hypothetical protein R3Y07_05640 [Eubacteriales bacterium]